VGSQVLETEADYPKIAASKEIPDYQEFDFIKKELALQKSDHLRRMVGITAGIIMVFLLLGGVGYRFRNGIVNNSPSMAANNAAAVSGEDLLQGPAARKILDLVDPAKRPGDMKVLSGDEQTGIEPEPSKNLGTLTPTREGRKKNRRVEIELSLVNHAEGQHLTANLDNS